VFFNNIDDEQPRQSNDPMYIREEEGKKKNVFRHTLWDGFGKGGDRAVDSDDFVIEVHLILIFLSDS